MWVSGVCSCVRLGLLKDEHHLDHATDEEKLASSVGLRSDKEESGGLINQTATKVHFKTEPGGYRTHHCSK